MFPRTLNRSTRRSAVAAFGAGIAVAVLGFAGPVALAIVLKVETGMMGPRRVADLLDRFERQGYDLAAVLAGRAEVPRLFLRRLPQDWRNITEVEARKRTFVMVMLPLVLRTNERIRAERERLQSLAAAQGRRGQARAWLDALASAYGVDAGDRKSLRYRVDTVPPSLAIAQAAIESGWGTSRFAAIGNAMYGQRRPPGRGAIEPLDRASGQTFGIKSFGSLGDSVESYIKNLNTHRAYRAFRERRAALRRDGKALQGRALVGALGAYSERGRDYTSAVRELIERNGLARLDTARLRGSRP